MSKRSPRLLFTEEEKAAPELQKVIKKANKQMDKLDPLWFDIFVFDYEEAEKKLYKMLKYLYKNHA